MKSIAYANVPPLYASIDGSRGVMVFGEGISAVRGEITEVHPDYVRLESEDGRVYHVRTFKYWRFDEDLLPPAENPRG